MKISKLFHSLYAILMFLPVMVIPIFAININQKSVEPIQVEVQERHYYETNEVHTSIDIMEGNAYLIDLSNGFVNSENVTFPVTKAVLLEGTFIDSFTAPSLAEVPYVRFYTNNRIALVQDKVNTTDDLFPTYTNAKVLIIAGSEYTNLGNLVTYFQPYYEYYEVVTTIYNDTDIGSQFLYSLYIPVHDYFNIINWMNLGGLYDWFLLNIFNGVNALVIEIIFNLIVYWLMVSFVWLIFDVLMYVPSMIHKMLDKARME